MTLRVFSYPVTYAIIKLTFVTMKSKLKDTTTKPYIHKDDSSSAINKLTVVLGQKYKNKTLPSLENRLANLKLYEKSNPTHPQNRNNSSVFFVALNYSKFLLLH